jgi:predicted amidohydrolase YtcJ
VLFNSAWVVDSVRFADGLIVKCSAASAAQEGDDVIDAGGGTVLPGLIDAHVHLAPGALAQSLTFGVTTVLDMFSKPDLVARAKEQAGSRPEVADVRSSGVGATAPGRHPSMMSSKAARDETTRQRASSDSPAPVLVRHAGQDS